MGNTGYIGLIGRRYALSRRHSHLVSFISSVSIVGLVIGVALLITVLAIMNGFDRELRDRILGIMPHAALYHRDGVADYRDLAARVNAHPGVTSATPFVQLEGLLSHKREVAPVGLVGVPPEQRDSLAVLSDYLPEGIWNRLADNPRGVLLGAGLARSLSVKVDDKLILVVPAGEGAPRVQALAVLAVFDTGTELDNNLALTALETASGLTGHPGAASGIRFQVHDLFSAPQVARDLVYDLPGGYYSSDWTRTHGNLYQAIHMSKQLVGLLLFLIIAIAAFNLVSTLIMVVVDKQGDIAILRTLGASSAEILGIFMIQGGMIGVVGTGIGTALGVTLSYWVTDWVQWLEGLLGVQFLQSDVYPISYLPSDLHWPDVAQVAGTALVLSLVASLYPAWRATRVQPAEALRFE
ncbi:MULTISPECIES: lipoprotein-releasing ABC transporter permease subunit [unclassified Marinimicrobium]|uniref:lipoprotein-releasing ABC transporter permease subunit n=1 Tax=unclassified Marinimicrobium TaxID=2632100 RepID=UPI00257A73C4|nr:MULTISPECIES: lipoprotein-releasing ABC transporter permease subunit [unclassified Marinimicrobium]|tara:strand:- start:387 stop:1616 length:1230 start_codon:yes stop_codon:yes gene_type:complete